jgi:hypothetical protein
MRLSKEERGWMEEQSEEKMKYYGSLKKLMFQLRRTDAELRRVTGDKTMKEFETDILKMMTLIRSLMFAYQAAEALMTGGLSTIGTLFQYGMIGMSGVTSITVMSELS